MQLHTHIHKLENTQGHTQRKYIHEQKSDCPDLGAPEKRPFLFLFFIGRIFVSFVW